MALYSGVPSIRLEGDQKRALAAIPEAKAMLQTVQEFLSASGANTFSMSRKFGDDGDIYVLCANGQNIIRIRVGEPLEEPKPEPAAEPPGPSTLPSILSGIVTNGEIRDFQVNVNGEIVNQKLLTSFHPTPNCQFTHDLRPGSQPSGRLAVRPWVAFNEWRDRGSNPRDFSQYAVPRPSWWSGKMKRVVQAVMGFGKIRKSTFTLPSAYADEVATNGVQVRFDYKFNRTHGIVVAADNRLWLVEIGIARGVLAMPLPVFDRSATYAYREEFVRRGDTAMVTILDELGCLPTGEAFPGNTAELNARIARGDILRLMTPAQMHRFYIGSGFSSVCGWAFSESGHEAHNVCYFYPDDDPIQRSAWYQINISIGQTLPDWSPGAPIASGSATMSKQREGKMYSPRSYKGLTPVYYFEPMLDPPGLLRHSAVPLDEAPHDNVESNAPVYVAIHDGTLKLGMYFFTPSTLPPTITTDYDEDDPCLLEGAFHRSVRDTARVPIMTYTNDIDDRKPCVAFGNDTTFTSSGYGYGGMQVIELVDAPAWALLVRAKIFRQTTLTDEYIGEQVAGVFVAPAHSREAYYYLGGTWFEGGRIVTFSTGYRSVRDPNIGYGWVPGIGPRFLVTSIGTLDAWTCGQSHPDRRIIAAGYSANGPCAEYADGGGWLGICDSIQSYVGGVTFLPTPHWRTIMGRDFKGTATLVSTGLNSPVEMPISEDFLKLYNDIPLDDSGSSPPTLFALHSAVGERTVIYTRLNQGIAGTEVDGYVPSSESEASGFPCFIGANHP